MKLKDYRNVSKFEEMVRLVDVTNDKVLDVNLLELEEDSEYLQYNVIDVRPQVIMTIMDGYGTNVLKKENITSLNETTQLMISNNWEERFKAEYFQTRIRYERLKKILENWDNLDFTPKNSKEVLDEQLAAMKAYVDAMERRVREIINA